MTTAPMVSAWTVNTLEALPIAKRMARLGVAVLPYTSVTRIPRRQGPARQRFDWRGIRTLRHRSNHSYRALADGQHLFGTRANARSMGERGHRIDHAHR